MCDSQSLLAFLGFTLLIANIALLLEGPFPGKVQLVIRGLMTFSSKRKLKKRKIKAAIDTKKA